MSLNRKQRVIGKYILFVVLVGLEVLPLFLIPTESGVPNSGVLKSIIEIGSTEEQKQLLDLIQTLKYLTVTFALMSVAVTMLFWSLLGKSPKVDIRTEYIHEPPYPYGPAIVGWLMRLGKAGLPDMVATIMNLAYRNVLEMKKVETDDPRKPNFEFQRYLKAELTATAHEKELLHYLFDMIAVSNRASLRDLQNYADSFPERIARFLKRWNKTILQETEHYGFIEKPAVGWMALNLIMGCVTVALGSLMLFLSLAQAIPAILIGALQIFATVLMKRRTHTGETHYQKWKAFKRFLVQFSDLKSAYPESMLVWEKFLVYAISLGVAKEVQRRMEILPFLETSAYGVYDFDSLFTGVELGNDYSGGVVP